jgi:uncharacterized protein YkwD
VKTKLSHLSVQLAALSALLCLIANFSFAQSTPGLDSQQLAFLTLIDNYRAQNGAGPLQVSIALENSSTWMANDMWSRGYFSHNDSLGRNPFTRMAAFNYPYLPAGENIFWGSTDAQVAFNAWQNACDPDASGQCTFAHRRNMLYPGFVVIGIGRVGTIWVTDFGGFLDATIPTSSVSVPAITSFAASPSQIASGQSSTLTWTVSGATTVAIDHGVGDVSRLTSTSVSPAQTTTYTLTATNSAGSTTATALVTVASSPPPPPPPPGSVVSIWSSSTLPAIGSATVNTPVELGVKFRSDISGVVTGIRFYKSALNTGTHTGSLWSSTGTLLATGTFTNETSSGWQTLMFSSPVAISANTTYIASYHSSGFLSLDFNYFLTKGADNPPLHALQYGVDGPNGLLAISPGGQFPNTGNGGHNFWVDVLFSSAAPPPPILPTPQSITVVAGSSQSATVGAAFSVPLQVKVLDGSLNPMSNVTVTFNAPVSGASAMFAGGGASATVMTNANGIAVAPSLTANTTVGSYTIAASVGNLAPAQFSLSNTAAPPPPPPSSGSISIWPDSTTPAIRSATVNMPVELGVKFRSDVSGLVTGIRFYKGLPNTGTHTGSLWTSTGTLLATATFTNETGSGWQTLMFSSPVPISANTTYVASYHSPNGTFSLDFDYFLHGVDNAPLHALQYGVDGPNGLLLFSPGGQFPAYGNGNNYWVDVVFQH